MKLYMSIVHFRHIHAVAKKFVSVCPLHAILLLFVLIFNILYTLYIFHTHMCFIYFISEKTVSFLMRDSAPQRQVRYIYIAQSVQRLTTGWTVRDRIPMGTRFSTPFETGPGAHPAPCTMGTGSFPGVKRPGLGVDIHPHLAPRLKEE